MADRASDSAAERAHRNVERGLDRGRAELARIRREVWPDCGGYLPEEPTLGETERYMSLLESEVVGKTMAMSMIARTLGS